LWAWQERGNLVKTEQEIVEAEKEKSETPALPYIDTPPFGAPERQVFYLLGN